MVGEKDALARMQALLSEIRSEERGMSLEDIKRLRGMRLSRWLRETVQDVLRGYRDRERCIREKGAPVDVLAEYVRLNRAIDDAVGAVCFGYDAGVVSSLREDMIRGRGWQKAVVSDIFSERTFYKTKERIYLYVAARLSLI